MTAAPGADANRVVLCADGVQRFSVCQWQAYLAAAEGDPEETSRRLADVPSSLVPLVEAYLRTVRLRYWVNEVLLCDSLDVRRAVLQQCPPDLRADVRDQVAVLWDLRRSKGRAAR